MGYLLYLMFRCDRRCDGKFGKFGNFVVTKHTLTCISVRVAGVPSILISYLSFGVLAKRVVAMAKPNREEGRVQELKKVTGLSHVAFCKHINYLFLLFHINLLFSASGLQALNIV